MDAVGAATPLPPEAHFQGPAPASIPSFPGAIANLPILDGAPLGHGMVNGTPDADGITRRVPMVGRVAGSLTPGLALELVRVGEGLDKIQLEGGKGGLSAVRLGRHRLPVDAQGRLELRFRGLPGTSKVSAVTLLQKGFDPHRFEGKIVLVGLTAAGTSDVVTTPRSLTEAADLRTKDGRRTQPSALDRRTYGALVQVEAIDAILRGAAMNRPVWAQPLEWLLSVGLVIGAWLTIPRLGLRPIMIVVAASVLGVLGVVWGAFAAGLLLDPTPILAPAAASTAAMIGLLVVEGRRLQARLRAALDEERLSAAKIAGELSAAADIQSGMLLPREALRQVSTAIEIDAVLQPAKSVGGDLYDAFMLDVGRLCFLVGDVTGKGVPASLFMALSKALSRSLLMRPKISLKAAVEGMNAELSRDNGQMMAVSLLVGVLDLKTGTLDLCNAGHENPLVVSADGAVRELALDGGPALCVAQDYAYPVERHRLERGETLVAYTDGVTEAQDPTDDLFGRGRAMAVLSAEHGALDELIDTLVAAVRTFEAGEDASDDLTVLAVRRPA
jgi:serine phosphatase RsbU (regulator of sigma subunit)